MRYYVIAGVLACAAFGVLMLVVAAVMWGGVVVVMVFLVVYVGAFGAVLFGDDVSDWFEKNADDRDRTGEVHR